MSPIVLGILAPLAVLAAARCGAVSGATSGAAGCMLVNGDAGPAGTVPLRVERVVTGLEVPWGIAFLPGGDALVTERPGRVRLLRGGRLEPAAVTTIPVGAGEGGLLGIAADPRFGENRRFYVYYTRRDGGRAANRVVRYVLADDGRSAREDRVIIDGIPSERFHDGGRLRFGPDGMLYVGTGDAGTPARSQDPATLAGKILRVTPDGAAPPDNPTPGSRAFISGVRNVEAFDWLDPTTLVVADHGPSGELGRTGHDEVTVARAGANLGWPETWACGAKAGTTSPALVFENAVPPGGGAVYRGEAIPAWKGSFLVGTLGSRHLLRVVLGADGTLQSHEVYLHGEPPAGFGRLRDVVQAPDGSLWVTTSNCDGRGECPPEKDAIVRIVGG